MEATSNTYFHHDAIGSVVALSNDSGQVTDTYEYEPFGKVLQHQGTSTNDYQFVGGYGVRKLNDTLDVMGVRQYSENTGRFTSQDPLLYKAHDLNFYHYAANNPHEFFDPDGKKKFKLYMFFGGSVGTGVAAGATDAIIEDTVCGDSTFYVVYEAGLGADVKLPSFYGISWYDFNWGNSYRSWSFEGYGSISGFYARVGPLGVSAFTNIQIPNGPHISDYFSLMGAVDLKLEHRGISFRGGQSNE
jgi:RHS repeat-associated protein